MRALIFSLVVLLPSISKSQDGYGNQWIFGRNSTNISGTILNFNDSPPKTEPINKPMELEGSCAIMCDSVGKLLFYSNGCYIANATHQMMTNGDSIGKKYLESSFCNTGGNPMTQGMIALPKPGNSNLYYLFYTDIGNPYFMQPFFPLAPITLYYAVIDMKLENGLGAVVEKNKVIVQDTFALSMIQAERHANGKDWWVVIPKSHSNCYWTFLITENGVDTVFKQCIGLDWIKNDPQGQSVFSPNSKKYVRFNFFYGLNIFNFDASTGVLSSPLHIGFGQDTFYYNGAAFSPNSRFIYAPAFNKLWQFDTWASDISASRILIAELNTPSDISSKTRFNQARLAPDGKIYIAGTVSHNYLHVINRPNCYGIECGLQQYAVKLAAPNSQTMPNMPHFKRWNEGDTCQTVSATTLLDANKNTVRFYPNPAGQDIMAEGLEPGDKIDCFDVSGRIVKSITFSRAGMDIESLSAGFYFLKIRRGILELGTFKIVKH